MGDKSYEYVRAWGYYMGSHNYYIRDQIDEARRQKAPADAIFEEHTAFGPSGKWARFSELDPEVQKSVQSVVAHRGLEINLMLPDASAS